MTTTTPNYNLALREGSYRAARLVSVGWHGGTNHAITGLSHGREWNSFELVTEIEQELSHLPKNQLAETKRMRAELEAFRYWALHFTDISAVYSAFDHDFLTEDGYSNCLSCGAQFQLVHNDPTYTNRGRYRGFLSRDPQRCTGPSVSHENADACTCLLH